MSLYPSLEDMKVDQMMKAQLQPQHQHQNYGTNYSIKAPSAPPIFPPTVAAVPYPLSPPEHVYPNLGDYMGLELSPEIIAANLPEYSPGNLQIVNRADMSIQPANMMQNIVAPLSSQSIGLKRATVTNGIRELILCKDEEGKVGLRVEAISNGIFVNLVTKNSPAALAGLRFGDQILQINGKNVAGFSVEQVHDIFKKCPVNGISVVVRDRPFERTVTLHKDSAGRVGFTFRDGKVIALVVDSSAARNGLLTDHQLLEVNGQNVVGLKDKEITKIITDEGDIITVTIIPSFIYQHMTKKMASRLIKGSMDHSIPNL